MFRGNEKFDQYFFNKIKDIQTKKTIPLSKWSEENIVLSSAYAAETGQFQCISFQRDILDSISDPLNRQVVIVASSQIGKSQILSNFLIYQIVEDPSPTLYVHYSLKMATKYVKTRFRSMLRDMPVLAGTVDMDSRKAGNTLDYVEYAGGSITHVGSNSPGGLASAAIRYLILDEVDRYSDNVEGDPVQIASQRTKTYARNRKIIMASSPANIETSKIWHEFQNTNQQYFHVPCVNCGHFQPLDFKQMRWTETDGNTDDIHYICPNCSTKIYEKHKNEMVEKGKWVASNTKKSVGFHINELYSPFSSWDDIVKRFVEANELAKAGDYSKIQVFRNTTLALPWEEDYSSDVDIPEILTRVEEFSRDTKDYVITTLGLDTQDSRVEGVLVGWDNNEESWILDRPIFPGNPSLPEFWTDVEKYIIERNITITNIDSGGHNTDAVYQFCKNNIHNKVYPIKGSGDNIRSVCDYRPSFKNRYRVPLYFVGTISAKTMLYQRAKILKKSGGGVIHWHKDICDERFFNQFFSERMVKSKQGKAYYEKISEKANNEVLDCMVYALHGLKTLNVNWKLLLENTEKRERNVELEQSENEKMIEKVTAVPQPQQQQVVQKLHRQSYAKRW